MKIQELWKYPREVKAYNLDDFVAPTGNFYMAVAVISKRANQINEKVHNDLQLRLEQYALEPGAYDPQQVEERVEIVATFERLPKPHIVAVEEYLTGRLRWKEEGQE